jgi:hypothetical protein
MLLLIFLQNASHALRQRHRTSLLDSSQRHTCVRGLDHYSHAPRLEDLVHCFGDLPRQALLDLQTVGEDVRDACQLRQAEDAALGGEVGDV